MAKILVLHSGGLDSTTCLYKACAEGHDTISLGIDYGQRLRIELSFAEKQCATKNIDRQLVEVRWSKPAREIPVGRDISTIKNAAPSTAFLPSRNTVFLALASAHAAGISADEVWIGINSVDFSGYPDCTPEFFEAYCDLQKISAPRGPIIRAPLLTMSKPQIAKLASSLGIKRGDTWSCYRPAIINGAIVPCGTCDACNLHEYAWQEAGL